MNNSSLSSEYNQERQPLAFSTDYYLHSILYSLPSSLFSAKLAQLNFFGYFWAKKRNL
jgi:hypothetical protein